MSKQDISTAAFLATLLADTSGSPAPASAQAIQEMQEELAKRNADEFKERMRSLASYNATRLENLRDLDRRRKQIKGSLAAIEALAKAVVEGKLDTSEHSFESQLADAVGVKGARVNV